MRAEGPVTILIDGRCGLCRRQAALFARLDRGRGRVVIRDVRGADATPPGCSLEDALRQMHALLPDGGVVAGMEAIRCACAALGWGWLLAPTGWPVLRPLFDRFYTFLARHRMRLTPPHR
jgi:predicted DCC family thiol-disulfide oxidoreductase YuxK